MAEDDVEVTVTAVPAIDVPARKAAITLPENVLGTVSEVYVPVMPDSEVPCAPTTAIWLPPEGAVVHVGIVAPKEVPVTPPKPGLR
jgi:hypothetical protein